MSTIISTAIINSVVWVPTIIRSKNKLKATAVAVVSYVLSLLVIIVTRYLLTL